MGGLLDFDRRTVVVTGAASGIGAVAVNGSAPAGTDVHAVDIVPIADATGAGGVREHRCDLGDEGSIDAAVVGLPSRIDVLVNSAGVPNGGRFSASEVMAVNWLGLRHLTESLPPRMPSGSAVVHVASTSGRDWASHRRELVDLRAAGSFESGVAWVAGHPDVCGDGDSFSKDAVQSYTMVRAQETARVGVRMNNMCPGVTNTGLVDDSRRGSVADVVDRATALEGRMAEPAEMAPALMFLADDAASSFVNGVNLVVDGGSGAARATTDG